MGAYDLGELGPAAAISGGLQGLLEAYKMKMGQDVEQAKLRQSGFNESARLSEMRKNKEYDREFDEKKLKQDYDLATMPPKFITLPDPNNPGATMTIATGQRGRVQSLTRNVPKVDRKELTRETAMGKVSGNLQEIARLYGKLSERGAIADTSKGALTNIGSRMSSSPLGQALGKAVGGQSQSLRNQINQIRPLLINDIRKASEMGAKGMDSEKELEFFLQAATDPSVDIQTNLNAIKVLDKAYGLGYGITGGGTPQPQASGGKYSNLTDAQIQAAMGGQ